VGEIGMDNVSPRRKGNGRGSVVDGVPRKACAKDSFAVCTGAAVGAGEAIYDGTDVASLL
jgi:formylmethanofuran dehydrogenase subunit E